MKVQSLSQVVLKILFKNYLRWSETKWKQLNTRFCSKFRTDSRFQQDTPEDGRILTQLKCCKNCLNNQKDTKNYTLISAHAADGQDWGLISITTFLLSFTCISWWESQETVQLRPRVQSYEEITQQLKIVYFVFSISHQKVACNNLRKYVFALWNISGYFMPNEAILVKVWSLVTTKNCISSKINKNYK